MLNSKRINKEIAEFCKDPPEDFVLCNVDDQIDHWSAVIFGPVGTPYEGGAFFLNIKIPHDYPFKPPFVRFTTQIYHCNVQLNGWVSLRQL